jgi:hypothetical protein
VAAKRPKRKPFPKSKLLAAIIVIAAIIAISWYFFYPGARVVYGDIAKTTGRDGRVYFTALKGTAPITVEKAGYAPYMGDLASSAAAPVETAPAETRIYRTEVRRDWLTLAFMLGSMALLIALIVYIMIIRPRKFRA